MCLPNALWHSLLHSLSNDTAMKCTVVDGLDIYRRHFDSTYVLAVDITSTFTPVHSYAVALRAILHQKCTSRLIQCRLYTAAASAALLSSAMILSNQRNNWRAMSIFVYLKRQRLICCFISRTVTLVVQSSRSQAVCS